MMSAEPGAQDTSQILDRYRKRRALYLGERDKVYAQRRQYQCAIATHPDQKTLVLVVGEWADMAEQVVASTFDRDRAQWQVDNAECHEVTREAARNLHAEACERITLAAKREQELRELLEKETASA